MQEGGPLKQHQQSQSLENNSHSQQINGKIENNEAEKTQVSKEETQPNKDETVLSDEEVIPDHFYDSDLNSVNEKDFLSDNEPPKDLIQERKLLFKEKLVHCFKTIIRLGYNLEKPARYDRVKLKWKEVPAQEVIPIKLKKGRKDKKAELEEKETGERDKKQTEEEDKNGQIEKKEEKQLVKEEETEEKPEANNENQLENSGKDYGQQGYPSYFNTFYLMDAETIEYNIGKDHLDIETFVTSMKRGEAAVFQLEHLSVSKKNNLKTRVKVQVFVLWVEEWTTVIDIDCDGKFMKEVVRRGEGHSRIAKHDEVAFEFSLKKSGKQVFHLLQEQPVRINDLFLETNPKVLWKIMHSLKAKEIVRVYIDDSVMKEIQGDLYDKLAKVTCSEIQPQLQAKSQEQSLLFESNGKKVTDQSHNKQWVLELEIIFFHSLDDIFLDGRLLKKMIVKGVSTAKPDSSSLVYYALKYYSPNGELLFEDPFFNSDWWEDFSKLDLLGCRKSHLDDQSISLMLKKAIKRMKPAEVADIQCRDPSLFTYGSDWQQYKQLTGFDELPAMVKLGVRVYNFVQGRNCFNMELQEKVHEARRKKPIAVKQLERGNIDRALKGFENIVSFFSSGQLNQEAYDEKISALMNSTLCHMKKQNYRQTIALCDQILESPRHGYDPQKLKIKGPGHAKIQGKLPDEPDSDDERESAELEQNPKIIDKCLYRKALALVKMGEGQNALQCLSKMKVQSEQALTLEKEATKLKANYEKKSAKMYKNMFG